MQIWQPCWKLFAFSWNLKLPQPQLFSILQTTSLHHWTKNNSNSTPVSDFWSCQAIVFFAVPCHYDDYYRTRAARESRIARPGSSPFGRGMSLKNSAALSIWPRSNKEIAPTTPNQKKNANRNPLSVLVFGPDYQNSSALLSIKLACCERIKDGAVTCWGSARARSCQNLSKLAAVGKFS